jgi:bifunctional DNA-binding transcriptional regulator/antitoxin component of YhaV-PrlF toxin-antitoxin module
MADVVRKRTRGQTRVSAKNQVSLPVDAMREAGLGIGDRLRAETIGPGSILLTRVDDPVDRYAGTLTDVYPEGYLEDLRREWA